VIPASGWLPQANNTNSPPSGHLLPIEFVAHYFEGGDGVILGATELDFRQIELLFVTSFIRERFGFGRSSFSDSLVRMFTIDMVQPDIFGVLLLDSFTPPAVGEEFFEFPAYTQLACVGCEDGAAVSFGACALGTAVITGEDGGVEVLEIEYLPISKPFTEVAGRAVSFTE
jgi:hypothetical protein